MAVSIGHKVKKMGKDIKPTLAVMAAGLGQRYGGLKQIVPVNGRILLEYAIHDALEAGFRKVVILIRDDFKDDYMKMYGSRIEKGVKSYGASICYAFQEHLLQIRETLPFRDKIWGTGNAALCFKKEINEPFATINSDEFYGIEPFKLLYNFLTSSDYNSNGNIHAWIGYRIKNSIFSEGTVSRGIGNVSNEWLDSIIEREQVRMVQKDKFEFYDNSWKPLNPNTLVSANLWAFNPTIFPYLEADFADFLKDIQQRKDPTKEFYLPSLVNRLLQSGKIRVKVLPTEGQCLGLTYQKDHSFVVRKIEESISHGYPDKLW